MREERMSRGPKQAQEKQWQGLCMMAKRLASPFTLNPQFASSLKGEFVKQVQIS